MNNNAQNRWMVIKFGGTSVSSLAVWENIATIVRDHLARGDRPLVVCSAPSGVSNHLEALLQQAVKGDTTEISTKIFNQYKALANELGVVDLDALEQYFSQLRQLIDGIHLLGEKTPRVHAKVMALGELLLTRIGANYLNQRGLKTQWQDARLWLTALNHADFRHPDAYLSAHCASDTDPLLQQTLATVTADVVITQGFIAQNARQETVLLGRGGSDSSATYLAAKINALDS